jgi:hypothetical protein
LGRRGGDAGPRHPGKLVRPLRHPAGAGAGGRVRRVSNQVAGWVNLPRPRPQRARSANL